MVVPLLYGSTRSYTYVKYNVFSTVKKLWEKDSINLAYVVPKFAKIWHIGFLRKHEIKKTVTFEWLVE